MSSRPIGVCAECGDSDLSVVSNILGILTFGVAFLASCLGFIVIACGASEEISRISDILKQTKEHIDRVEDYRTTLMLRADPSLKSLDKSFDDSIMAFRELRDDMEKELGGYNKGALLVRHFRWWYREKEVAAGMARLESCKQHLSAIQLTALL